jgi:hypothetical protein
MRDYRTASIPEACFHAISIDVINNSVQVRFNVFPTLRGHQ